MKLAILWNNNHPVEIGAGIYNYLSVWTITFLFVQLLIQLPLSTQPFKILLGFHIPDYKGIIFVYGHFTEEELQNFPK